MYTQLALKKTTYTVGHLGMIFVSSFENSLKLLFFHLFHLLNFVMEIDLSPNRKLTAILIAL